MVFGFGKKNQNTRHEEDDDDDDDDVELVNFQGAMNGNTADMAANARLVQAALRPTKDLITDAIERRAEVIRVDVKGERAQVALSIDGMPYSGGRLAKQQASAIFQMLKVLSGLDARLKGKAQSGGVKAEFLGKKYELSVEFTPQAEGTERLVVRVRDLSQKLETPMDLGFSDSLRQTIREVTGHRHGLIICCGPAGSGVTTTTYALLRGIDVYLYSIYSIANTTRELLNIKKFEVNPGDDIATSMGRMMREEADVIFVDPIRDQDTAQQLFSVADSICIVSEMQAKDCSSAIVQLREWAGDPQMASERIDAVFSPKLVRLLCTECREAFRPNPKLLEKVGLPPETKVLYRKGEPIVNEKTGEEEEPCEKCKGVGFYGRVAMMEVIIVSDPLRKLIASGAPADQIKALARAEGCLTFHKDGLRLVSEGKTSLEELQRVFKS
ncbi:GspE/PulE family protein [Schlesneria sp. DSM 10557]|uniref:GspE/PulE family protein n=1 Tax=Schlesneria sp. DSM 10557 TaxID=3044399 RepID=UPI0035A11CBC